MGFSLSLRPSTRETEEQSGLMPWAKLGTINLKSNSFNPTESEIPPLFACKPHTYLPTWYILLQCHQTQRTARRAAEAIPVIAVFAYLSTAIGTYLLGALLTFFSCSF